MPEPNVFGEIISFLSKRKAKYCPLVDKTCRAEIKVSGNILWCWYGVDFLQVQYAGGKPDQYIIIVKQKRFDNFRQDDRIKECRSFADTEEEVISYIKNRFSGGK